MALNPPILGIPHQEDGQQGHVYRFLNSILPYQDRFATAHPNSQPPTSPQGLAVTDLNPISSKRIDQEKKEGPVSETESAKRRYDRKMRRRARAAVVKPKGDGIKLGEALRETVKHSQESRKEAEEKKERERKRKLNGEGTEGGRKKVKNLETEVRTTHPHLFFSPSRRVTIPLDKAMGRRLGIKDSKMMKPVDLRHSVGTSDDGSSSPDARPNIESRYFSLAPIPLNPKLNQLPREETPQEQTPSIYEFAQQRGLPPVGIAGSASWPSASSHPKASSRSERGVRHGVPLRDQSTIGHLSSSFRFAPAFTSRLTHQLPSRPRAVPSTSPNRSTYAEPMSIRRSDRLPVDSRRRSQSYRQEPLVYDDDPPAGYPSFSDSLRDRDLESNRIAKGRGTVQAPVAGIFTPNEREFRPTDRHHDSYDGPNESISHNRHPDELYYPERSAREMDAFEDDRAADSQRWPHDLYWQHQHSLLDHASHDPYELPLVTPRLPQTTDTAYDIEDQLAAMQRQNHQAAIQSFAIESYPANAEGFDEYAVQYGELAGYHLPTSETSRIVKYEMDNPFFIPYTFEEGDLYGVGDHTKYRYQEGWDHEGGWSMAPNEGHVYVCDQ